MNTGAQPGTVGAARREALRLMQQGQLAEAGSLLERIIATRPDDADAVRQLGVVALLARDYQAATDILGRACRLAPGSATAHMSLGQALQGLGRHEPALAEFRRAVELDPEASAAHNLLGTALSALGRQRDARVALERAVELAPHAVDARYNLACVLEAIGEYAAAESTHRTLLEARPDSAASWNGLGNALLSQRRPDEALAAYARAAELAPAAAIAHANLGTVLFDQGRHDEALAAFRRAAQLDPDFPDALYHVARAELACGDTDAALAACERFLATVPDSQEALALQAFLLRDLDRHQEADRLLDHHRLVRAVHLPTPAGHTDMASFNASLSRHVLAHPSLEPDPYGASTRGGRHSANLLEGDKGPVAALETLVKQAVRDYVQSLPAERHPFLDQRHRSLRLVIQANLLDPGGWLEPHVHPQAWLSGAYYLQLPPGMDAESHAGWLEFFRPPSGIRARSTPRLHVVQPDAGMLVLFPSYFYHGTVPFQFDGLRISVGIDLIPERRP